MRITITAGGRIVFSAEPSELIWRLSRAQMLGNYHPRTGDMIGVLCCNHQDKAKAIAHTGPLAPIGQKESGELFEGTEKPHTGQFDPPL